MKHIPNSSSLILMLLATLTTACAEMPPTTEKAPAPNAKINTTPPTLEEVFLPVPTKNKAENTVNLDTGKSCVLVNNHAFFSIDIPDNLLSELDVAPAAMRTGVKSGDAFQVYLVPPDSKIMKTFTYHNRPPAVMLEQAQNSLKRYQRQLQSIEAQVEKMKAKSETDSTTEETARRHQEMITQFERRASWSREQLESSKALIKKLEAQIANEESGIVHEKFSLLGRLKMGATGRVEIHLPEIISKKANTVIVADIKFPDTETKLAKDIAVAKRWRTARMKALASTDRTDFSPLFLPKLEPGEVIGSRDIWNRRGWRNNRTTNSTELYSLFTGAAAIQESLQLENLLDIFLEDEGIVPTDSIDALSLKDHPFDQMRAGREYSGSALARLTPSDAIYARVSTLAEWLRLEDTFDKWGGSFLSAVSVNGKKLGVSKRYRARLGLGSKLMARLVGAKVIGEMAVIASDPLLQEGAGLAVIFAPLPEMQSQFNTTFEAQVTQLKLTRGAKESQIKIAGRDVTLYENKERTLSSYRTKFDDKLIIANNALLMEQIIKAAQKTLPALYDAADYQYYRALYALEDKETAFIYLSQDFFRKITSPGWRITRARRARAYVVMEQLQNAYKAALIDTGKTLDKDALLAAQYLPKQCEKYLTKIQLDTKTGTASFDGFGALGNLKSVDELIPTHVSQNDVAEYRVFKQEYERFWRQFIDPVGIRIAMGKNNIELDTLILPLINNSVYDSLRETLGPEKTKAAKPLALPKETLLCISANLPDGWAEMTDLNTGLNEMIFGYYSDQKDRKLLSEDWFGNALYLGVADGEVRFSTTPELNAELSREFTNNPIEGLGIMTLLQSIRLPVFAALEVKNAAAVEQLLNMLCLHLQQQLQQEMGPVIKHTTSNTNPKIHTIILSVVVAELHIHYTFVDNWLLIATTQELLASQVIAARKATPQNTSEFNANAGLLVRPSSFKKAALKDGVSWQGRITKSCLQNLSNLEYAHDAGQFKAAENFLDYKTVCPANGKYYIKNGLPACTIHNTRANPTTPLAPPSEAPTVKLMNDTKEVSVHFGFTGDGLRSVVQIKFNSPVGE